MAYGKHTRQRSGSYGQHVTTEGGRSGGRDPSTKQKRKEPKISQLQSKAEKATEKARRSAANVTPSPTAVKHKAKMKPMAKKRQSGWKRLKNKFGDIFG